MRQPNYYVMDWDTPGESPSDAYCTGTFRKNYRFNAGSLTVCPKNVPIECVLELGPEDDPFVMLPCYNASTVLLLRDDLLEAILEAGADNLQVFPAILRAEHDPSIVFTNYKGVNIIGAIRAMGTRETTAVSLENGGVFPKLLEGLYINTAVPDGTLIFRLAGALRAIIIHEKVKRCIEKRKIPYMWFRDQGEWCG